MPKNFNATLPSVCSRLYPPLRSDCQHWSGRFDFVWNNNKIRIIHISILYLQEAHVNTCYKHFYYFVQEFELVSAKELEPLAEMTAHVCKD